MAAKDTIDALEWLRKQIEQAPDPLREVLNEVVTAIMGAEVDTICGARYGEPSADRVNHRNGDRVRPWDTRAGTIPPEIPLPRRARVAHGHRPPPSPTPPSP